MFKFRDYQDDSINATIDWIRKSYDCCLLELATGAGKSLIVAAIAKWIKENSGKKVLCLAPSKELVEQNREKYLSYGLPASLFSASAGDKCLKHDVIFGSPKTVLNSIDSFGENIAAIIIDEAHGITPTVLNIISSIKEKNKKLRVVGLTATPYRTGSGYIYQFDEEGKPVPEDQAKNPFFFRLLHRVTAPYLISRGYLTQPIAEDIENTYDTSKLEKSASGKFTTESIEQAFEGKGRLTAAIVAQVVAMSQNKMGVMFFASTIQHAHEIMESLPKSNSRIITGATKKKEREQIVSDFKLQKFKYLVNVKVLTTGFDAPHVDGVAILAATESPGLFQQEIGRGLRLHENKQFCSIWDFAENIERHELEDDLFDPKISVTISNGEKHHVNAKCSVCGTVNEFAGRPNKENFEIDEEGYFLDLAGDRIEFEGQAMPAHFGRRCQGHTIIKGQHEQCTNRWSFKACPDETCNHENDIAARYCKQCKGELVDPNTKLVLEFKRMKQNPRMSSSDKVVSWFAQPWTSAMGNESLRIDWTTEFRTFSAWYSPDSRSFQKQALWRDLSVAVFCGRIAPTIKQFMAALNKKQGTMPKTITSQKKGDFFEVTAHNATEDILND